MIIRTQNTKNFTTVNNACFRDSTLSARAMGVYGYLMTLPDDWQIHMRELYTHFREGRNAINTAFKELADAGYVEKTRVKDESGKFTGWEYTIHETPKAAAWDTYEDYLKSAQWGTIRAQVHARDKNMCRLCDVVQREMHCHHWRYPANWKDDSLENVILVCCDCHSDVHGVSFTCSVPDVAEYIAVWQHEVKEQD